MEKENKDLGKVKEVKPVKEKKKITGKKGTSKLGIYKYFIAIGGVVLATIIFLSIWFSNVHGGLLSIKLDDYLKYNKLEERTVVYIGNDDKISKELTPVIQSIAKSEKRQYHYLDVSDLEATKDIQALQNVFVETQNALVIPMVLVIEKGKIVDTRTDKTVGNPTGMLLGYLDRDTLVKFLKDNKVY